MKNTNHIFANEVDVPKLWSDHSIQTSTLEDCVELGRDFTVKQDAMLVERKKLHAILDDQEKFGLVISLNSAEENYLRVDLKLSVTGHLADLASIPRTYFKRLLRKNPRLAVNSFNYGISQPLYDRGRRRYGRTDIHNPSICITRCGDMFGSAHHADDVVFLPDMFVLLGKRLKKNFDLGFVEGTIREELKKGFPKADVRDVLMSANKWEMRIVFRDNHVSSKPYELEVNDIVHWGISVTLNFEDFGVYLTITPIVWRLVCKNGMVMPSNFGLPIKRVRLIDLPSWKKHKMTWRTLLDNQFDQWKNLDSIIAKIRAKQDEEVSKIVDGLDRDEEVSKIVDEFLWGLAVAIIMHASAIAEHDKLARIDKKIQRAKKSELKVAAKRSDAEEFTKYVSKVLEDQGIKMKPEQVTQIVDRLIEEARKEGSKGRELTLWDVINAVTNYAQEAKTHNKRIELETCATKLLVNISEENFQMVA